MKKTIFTGVGTAIITPFNPDLSINYDKLGELIEFQIANHADCIVICGTTGEASTMPDAEHIAAIAYTVKKVNKRVPVIAGAGSNDTVHAIHLSKEAKAAGADALLHVTPYYNKTSQAGLIAHFNACADATDLPIVLYNVPSRTGLAIKPQTYKELSKHPNIVAVKEASGNISEIAQTAQLCGEDLTIYSGNDDQIVPLMSLGGKGVISVLSNILPKQVHDIVALYLQGNVKESLALQLKLLHLMNTMFIDVNPIPVKEAMNLMGMQVGGLRMPLTGLSQENLQKLKDVLTAEGLLK